MRTTIAALLIALACTLAPTAPPLQAAATKDATHTVYVRPYCTKTHCVKGYWRAKPSKKHPSLSATSSRKEIKAEISRLKKLLK